MRALAVTASAVLFLACGGGTPAAQTPSADTTSLETSSSSSKDDIEGVRARRVGCAGSRRGARGLGGTRG